jgi:hypothetical protein
MSALSGVTTTMNQRTLPGKVSNKRVFYQRVFCHRDLLCHLEVDMLIIPLNAAAHIPRSHPNDSLKALPPSKGRLHYPAAHIPHACHNHPSVHQDYHPRTQLMPVHMTFGLSFLVMNPAFTRPSKIVYFVLCNILTIP